MKDRELEISDYYMAEDRRGMIRGVCLAWDCSSFRKTKVLKVSPKFYPLLWSYKSLEKILPMAPFPSAGECFRELTITDYAVENRDAGIMHSLLCEIYYRHLNRKYHFMNFASCASDNILKAASGFWSNKMVSHIAFTSLDKEKFNMNFNLPYIDIAFL